MKTIGPTTDYPKDNGKILTKEDNGTILMREIWRSLRSKDSIKEDLLSNMSRINQLNALFRMKGMKETTTEMKSQSEKSEKNGTIAKRRNLKQWISKKDRLTEARRMKYIKENQIVDFRNHLKNKIKVKEEIKEIEVHMKKIMPNQLIMSPK